MGNSLYCEYSIEDKECDQKCNDENNYTPLPAGDGQLQTAQYLIDGTKCPANTRNCGNQTPLDLARDNGQAESDMIK